MPPPADLQAMLATGEVQQKLAKDNWRGDLRARLAELVGRPGAGWN